MWAKNRRYGASVTRERPRRAVGLSGLGGVLAILLLVGGCASRDDDPLPETGSGLPPSNGATVTTSADDKKNDEVDSDERVLEDYRKHWAEVVAAHAAGDPALKLADHAVNPRLSEVQQQIIDDNEAGKVTKGEPKILGAEVDSRDDGRAKVTSCLDSATWRYHDAESGRPLEELSKQRYVATATLLLKQATWKVSNIELQEDSCDG
jgi:hypothetical protein